MITYIILLWILITLKAPVWTYILLGLAGVVKILGWGYKLAKDV